MMLNDAEWHMSIGAGKYSKIKYLIQNFEYSHSTTIY